MTKPTKIAVVTGAGSGVGRATALALSRENYTVVLAGRRMNPLDDTAKLARDWGGHMLVVRSDVSDPRSVSELFHAVQTNFGRLDLLFNNAGIDLPYATTVVDTELSDWQRIIDINLKGVFLCVRHSLPVMMAQNYGVIISTASRAGLGATQGEAAYCASKGGVVSLTRQLAIDYAQYNIRVNSICPGGIDRPTIDRSEFLEQSVGALERRNEQIIQKVPIGRLCSPQDVAQAALYLASDASAYVTGTALVVDGGGLAL